MKDEVTVKSSYRGVDSEGLLRHIHRTPGTYATYRNTQEEYLERQASLVGDLGLAPVSINPVDYDHSRIEHDYGYIDSIHRHNIIELKWTIKKVRKLLEQREFTENLHYLSAEFSGFSLEEKTTWGNLIEIVDVDLENLTYSQWEEIATKCQITIYNDRKFITSLPQRLNMYRLQATLKELQTKCRIILASSLIEDSLTRNILSQSHEEKITHITRFIDSIEEQYSSSYAISFMYSLDKLDDYEQKSRDLLKEVIDCLAELNSIEEYCMRRASMRDELKDLVALIGGLLQPVRNFCQLLEEGERNELERLIETVDLSANIEGLDEGHLARYIELLKPYENKDGEPHRELQNLIQQTNAGTVYFTELLECVRGQAYDYRKLFYPLLISNFDRVLNQDEMIMLNRIRGIININVEQLRSTAPTKETILFLEESLDFIASNEDTLNHLGEAVRKRIAIADMSISGERLLNGTPLTRGDQVMVHIYDYFDERVAVKKVYIHELRIDWETFILKKFLLNSPDIICLFGISSDQVKVKFITKYMPQGSLYKKLYDDRAELAFEIVMKMAISITKGVAWIHENKHFHGDIKSSNILIDSNLQAKVASFGLKRLFKNRGALDDYKYMAPELFDIVRNQEFYDSGVVLRNGQFVKLINLEKTDIYALGMVLYELISSYNPGDRRLPFDGQTDFQIRQLVVEQKLRPVIPAYCPPEYRKIIEDCWAQDPASRPTSRGVLLALNKILNPSLYDMETPRKPLSWHEITERFGMFRVPQKTPAIEMDKLLSTPAIPASTSLAPSQ